jgi:hypothetical protein
MECRSGESIIPSHKEPFPNPEIKLSIDQCADNPTLIPIS